jgi:NTE family protein
MSKRDQENLVAAGQLGIALGSGSARGWAHVGVLEELDNRGVRPSIVCGTSVGALVGATYACGKLDILRKWAGQLTTRRVLKYLDLKFTGGGGLADGKRLMDYFREATGDPLIEDLPIAFCAVATDMQSGHEVWLREGLLWDAVRASIALPGLFTPVKLNGRWLLDGALVNPVPVTVCRALDADWVVGVNLGDGLLERPLRNTLPLNDKPEATDPVDHGLLKKITENVADWVKPLLSLGERSADAPDMFEVFTTSLDIMQDRITRSRLAGDPPDLLLAPRVSNINLLEFDLVAEAVSIGRDCVRECFESN